jgi:hypothetical protein
MSFLSTDRIMYARFLRNAEQTRRFTVSDAGDNNGWEVREETNTQVTRQVHYTDWHRVERAMKAFAAEAMTLRKSGWIEA